MSFPFNVVQTKPSMKWKAEVKCWFNRVPSELVIHLFGADILEVHAEVTAADLLLLKLTQPEGRFPLSLLQANKAEFKK